MRRILGPMVFLLSQACAPAIAAGISYEVQIEAPPALAEALRQGLDLVRWQDDPQMSPELLRRLAEAAAADAREAAAAEGYFSAEARVAVEEREGPWRVLLRVAPGERTRVAAIDIGFRGPAASDPAASEALERVRRAWPLRAGAPFRQADWEDAKQRAVRELSAWRYAAARIAASEARVDPAAREARLSVTLESGPVFRFGEVRVSGTSRYDPALVGNMSPVRAGEDYDRATLLVYQRRLAETGYFASVQVDLDARPEAAAAAPVHVAVLEAPTKHVEGGLSFNTDVGARLQLRYSDQDLRDSAWRLRTGFAVDSKIQELQADLDSPPRRGARWNNFFARIARTDIQNEIARSFAAGVAHNFGTDVAPSAAILSWHLEDQRTGTTLTDSRYAVYLGLRRTFRRTDDVINPRAGYFGHVEVGGGLSGLSSQDFVRAIGHASYVLPQGRRSELLLRAQSGVVRADARTGIPTTFLFRTGGDRTVRGYAYESIGVAEGDAIVGGRRLFVASAEYTQWIGENWGVAAFVDSGDAWDEGERFDPVVGHGLGVRLRTPIGPGRIDLAYGRETRDYRLHLSIGYVF
jgi:translocation and assembly module TamA